MRLHAVLAHQFAVTFNAYLDLNYIQTHQNIIGCVLPLDHDFYVILF
jgi:hypothetical protein